MRQGGSQEQVAECRPLLSTLKPPQAVGLLPQGKPIFKVRHVHKPHLAACVAAVCSFSQFPQVLPLAESLILLLFFSSQSLECGLVPYPAFRLCPTDVADFLSLQVLLAAAPASRPNAFLLHTLSIWTPHFFLVQDCFCWNRLVDHLEQQKGITARYDLFFAYQKKCKRDIPKGY